MKDIIDKYFDDGKKDKDVYSSCLKAKASITKRNYEAVHVQTLPLTKRSLGGNAKTDRSRNTCSK